MASKAMKIDINEFITKRSKREKIVLLVAVSIVGVALMDGLVIGPIASRLKKLDAAIETKKQEVRRDLRILSFSESILEEFEQYRKYFSEFEQTDEEIKAEYLRELEMLARVKEITIIDIETTEMRENPLVSEYQIEMKCEGSLGNVLTYINFLEESNFLFQIQGYELTPKSKDGSVMKVSLSISRLLIMSEDLMKLEGAHPG